MGLFESRKEKKTITLAKRLQEEADKEWERERNKRKEQELNDEAIAKALQAQLEEEERNPSTTQSTSNSPPPLPLKPKEYNSSTLNANNSNHRPSFSTSSLPTTSASFHGLNSPLATPPSNINRPNSTIPISNVSRPASTTPLSGLNKQPTSITPLYSLAPSSSSTSLQPSLPARDSNKNPVKSYVSSQSYQPELKFNLATPGPTHSAVFNDGTPKLTPSKSKEDTHSYGFYGNVSSSTPLAMQANNDPPSSSFQGHISMPEPINTTGNLPTQQPPFTPHKSDPVMLSLHLPTPVIPIVSPTHHYSNSYPSNTNIGYPPTPQGSGYAPGASNNNRPTTQGNYSGGYSPVANSNHGVYPPQLTQNSSNSSSGYPPPTTNPSNGNSGYPPTTNPSNGNNGYLPTTQNSTSNSGSYPPITSQSSNPSGVFTTPVNQNSNVYPPTTSQMNHSTYTPVSGTAQSNYDYTSSQSNNTSGYFPTVPVSQTQSMENVHASSSSNKIIQNSSQEASKPLIPTTVSSSGLQLPPMPSSSSSQNKKSTNPYENMKYSSSTISLKPDEEVHSEDDDWDIVKTTHHRPSTPIANHDESDDDSSYDYSDMVYSRNDSQQQHVEDDDHWEDQAIDPFADNFSVQVPVESNATSATIVGEVTQKMEAAQIRKPSVVTTLQPALQILDPTLNTTAVTKDEKTVEEKQIDATVIRHYEEKESNEVEPVPYLGRQPVVVSPFQPSPFHPMTPRPLVELDLPENEQLKVYPTNVVKAGAPPKMSKTNPYNKSSSSLKPVPATDHGYFKDEGDKKLPELPPPTSDEDRHITVASINAGQKVWIRINPTDTGKSLAERIGIVASYRTRRVTKITTKSGKVISIDNKPLFDDWKEILKFQEGELWRIEWEPIEHSSYVDIITEGKEFMKQLKANFKSSS